MRIHDSPVGVDHRLRSELVSKAKPRTEVLPVILCRRPAVAGTGSGARKLQRATNPSDWIHKPRAEETLGAMHFRDAGEKVVAQADVEGQLRIHLPVVLDVRRYGTETRTKLLFEILREASLVDFA